MDFDKCAEDLDALVREIEELDPNLIAEKVALTLEQNNIVLNKSRSSGSRCRWFTRYLYDLRQEVIEQLWNFHRCGSEYAANSYALLRGAYHRALRLAEQQFKEEEAEKLVEGSYREKSKIWPDFGHNRLDNLR